LANADANLLTVSSTDPVIRRWGIATPFTMVLSNFSMNKTTALLFVGVMIISYFIANCPNPLGEPADDGYAQKAFSDAPPEILTLTPSLNV
jgi:hypothetical protein